MFHVSGINNNDVCRIFGLRLLRIRARFQNIRNYFTETFKRNIGETLKSLFRNILQQCFGNVSGNVTPFLRVRIPSACHTDHTDRWFLF